MRKIDPDANRFRKIVRGKIRENLKQYVSQGELIARQGKKSVSVPLPQIDLPNFRFGQAEQGGVLAPLMEMVLSLSTGYKCFSCQPLSVHTARARCVT